jgi:hypothetical protein
MTREEFKEEIQSGRYGSPPDMFVSRAIKNLDYILDTLQLSDIRSDTDSPFHLIMDITARETTIAAEARIPLEEFEEFAASDLVIYLRNR